MWICLNNAFLSIVEPKPEEAMRCDVLLVRARRKGDIQNVFPHAHVERTPGRDYLFRSFIDRDLVAEVIAESVRSISYSNFKGSTKDHSLHNAYMSIWRTMAQLQPLKPYENSHATNYQGRLI